MRMLERSFKVTTRYSGGFVESIDGHAGSSSRLDWFYYVNGIEASLGAAGTSVHKGDRIWWDLHDWTATDSIPAVVGSFPEPFIHGIDGRRFPVTLECATDATAACQRVTSELDSHRGARSPARRSAGAREPTRSAWSSAPGTTSSASSLADADRARPGVERGLRQVRRPQRVLARAAQPARAGRAHARRRRRSDRGHRAALDRPVWLITGTDAGRVSRPPPRRSRRRGCATTSRSRSRAAPTSRCRWRRRV